MVVYPYLANNGFLLYRDIINPYPPALNVFLVIFTKSLGYNPILFQLLAWAIIIIVDLLIFKFALKITKSNNLALLSLVFFVIFSLAFGINGLWFDLVQTPLLLSGFFYFYQYLKDKKPSYLFYSFIFVLIAFFIKQQAIWLIFWFLIILIFKRKVLKLPILKTLLASSLIFLAIAFLHLTIFSNLKVLHEFFFWTVYFPLFKASQMPGYILLPTKRQAAVILALFLIFLPLTLSKKSKLKLIIPTALFSLVFAYPRFDYFHLIPTLSILSIAFGENLKIYLKANLKIKIICLTVLVFLALFGIRYLVNNWGYKVRFFEPEIIAAAEFVSLTAQPKERLYIQNGPDQLLPLAKRLPIKPWADEFPWYLEMKDLQEKIITSFKINRPAHVIYKPYSDDGQYELGSYRPQKIADYIDQNYQNLTKISDNLWLKIRK